MFEIKNDSIVEDYIANSKHTNGCFSKEFQVAEECKCWRVEFAKSILAKQEMKKKIYVSSKVKFAPIWKKFRSEGYPILSSWLDEADKTNTNMAELWKKNIEESSSCGVLVYFAELPTGIVSKKETVSHGGLVEVGSALSNDVPVVWAAMEYPSVCKHPNIRFTNGCDDIDSETEIRFALDEAMKILNLISPAKTKTLAEVYLDFIQTKWTPKYNFGWKLDEWKKDQTLKNVEKYLKHFERWYRPLCPPAFFFDKNGNEYSIYEDPNNEVITKWWSINKNIQNALENEIPDLRSMFVWDSFVAWCYANELPRKTFGIGLKEEMNLTVKVIDRPIAKIPSVKCEDAKKLSVEITDLSLVKDSSDLIVKTVSALASPKARKLKRIKTHSCLVKCTNKSRRVISAITTEITCGHCLKLGKKKGLWA